MWPLCLVLTLCGCETSGEQYEEAYNNLAKEADYRARCRAARQASDAYILDRKPDSARKMSEIAEQDCFLAATLRP